MRCGHARSLNIRHKGRSHHQVILTAALTRRSKVELCSRLTAQLQLPNVNMFDKQLSGRVVSATHACQSTMMQSYFSTSSSSDHATRNVPSLTKRRHVLKNAQKERFTAFSFAGLFAPRSESANRTWPIRSLAFSLLD